MFVSNPSLVALEALTYITGLLLLFSGVFPIFIANKKYYSPRVQQHPLQAGLVDQRLFGGNCRQK
jgi:hypothetical protein